MKENLEELEHRLFMLKMQDTWESSDYRYANELEKKKKKLKEEQNND